MHNFPENTRPFFYLWSATQKNYLQIFVTYLDERDCLEQARDLFGLESLSEESFKESLIESLKNKDLGITDSDGQITLIDFELKITEKTKRVNMVFDITKDSKTDKNRGKFTSYPENINKQHIYHSLNWTLVALQIS